MSASDQFPILKDQVFRQVQMMRAHHAEMMSNGTEKKWDDRLNQLRLPIIIYSILKPIQTCIRPRERSIL